MRVVSLRCLPSVPDPKEIMKSNIRFTRRTITPIAPLPRVQTRIWIWWSVCGVLLAVTTGLDAAPLTVDLRSAARFAILAGSGVSSIPTTSIQGDVGLSPAARSKITGLTASEVHGSLLAADDGGATAAGLIQAKADLDEAYRDAGPGSRPGGIDVSSLGGGGGELGGRTLAPGLYRSSSGSYSITSLDLTLDAKGDPSAVWVFQMATTLQLQTNRQVLLIGGAQARNIFWQVGSSATLGTSSVIEGTIMAQTSITFQTGAVMRGRALAQTGAVVLHANAIDVPEAATSVGAVTLLSASTVLGPFSVAAGQSVDPTARTIMLPIVGNAQYYRLSASTVQRFKSIRVMPTGVVLTY